MTDEELKKMWKNATKDELVRFNKDGLQKELNARLLRSEILIRKRNKREIIAATIYMPCAAIVAWFVHPLLSKIAALLVIPYCLFVITKLKGVRKYKIQDVTLPLKDYLLQCKNYMEKEKDLLSTVAYWYVGPAMVCASLFCIGLHRYSALIPVFTIGFLIYYINQRAARNVLRPIIEKIDIEISSLTGNE